MELGCGIYSPYWLRYYIQLLISTSFFNACLEFGIGQIHQGITKIYNTGRGSNRHQRIFKLVKVCYSAYAKYNSGFKISQYEFKNALITFPWEYIFFLTMNISQNCLKIVYLDCRKNYQK